ncbi:hypothetical protein [Amycolatopsis sp. DSM 110486]|uniref:hypothetical protein n=1 Tax=Amycolatopsis sp. DSM 110486 TaxID=2865832 RepID=UPI001C6953F1|nr:hypothetical protein [Amycolatopsis sp. DSM 110486]QYN18853.1 hypothetical protein K1T34_40080 [Amycolatopsis sp. DSM 110486]
MGFFGWVGDTAKAVGHGLEDAADWAGDRLSDVGNWFGDLYHGNLGEQTVPASNLVQMVMASKGAPEWHDGSAQASQLAQQHAEMSGRVQQLSSNLESVWTGGGADAAQARIRPLADVSQSASETFTSNSRNVSDLAHGFDELKSSLQPMPANPPHKNFFDEAAWWQTDTEKQIQDYNNVSQQNLQKYQGYAAHAQTAGQGLKSDYGQLADFGGGNVTIGSGHPVPGQRSGPNSHDTTASGPGSSAGYQPSTGGSSPTFTQGQGPTVPATNGPSATTPVGFQPGSGPGDGTATSGWTPPSTNPTGGPSWAPPSSLPPGGGSSGGNSWSPGGVSGFGPTSGFGGGGFGGESGGVSGGGRAGGSAGRLGAGSGAGAGAEESMGRGGAGVGARGAAGARGSSGMGGMGGAGKGGKGEEDKEHQRKYVLEDDSAFDIVDDEDGRLRDPWSGLPPTPPTIGG